MFQPARNFALRSLELSNKCESPIEQRLIEEMTRRPEFVLCREGAEPQGRGIFIRTQVPVGPYFADFMLTCVNYPQGLIKVWPPSETRSICVECDGKQFHHVTQEQIDHDMRRDEYFLSKGIKTYRFTGSEIHKNVGFCVDQIIHHLGWMYT